MDFKVIAWPGNIYQKFEELCLEVEEVICQDTVKYMENQVQKVGVTVKNFYSEVLEDLLPPPCEDKAHTDNNKKPIPSILDKLRDLKKNKNEDNVISDVTSQKESSLIGYYDINSLYRKSPRASTQNKCSEKSKVAGFCKRPVGIHKISQNKQLSKDSYRETSLSLDSHDMNVILPLDLDLRNDSVKEAEGNSLMSNSPIAPSVSEKKISDELLRLNTDDSESVCHTSDNNLSAKSVRLSKADSKCTSSSLGLPRESVGTSMDENSTSILGSGIRSNACNVEPEDRQLTVKEDSFEMEVIGKEEVAELPSEIFRPVERREFEETCVLVDGDRLHSVPQGPETHKSYKKRISKALSAKLRSRKHNQGASQPKDFSGEKNVECEKGTLAVYDSLESDWELV